MALGPLPPLQLRLSIVNGDGTPTITFHRYFNTDFAGAIFRNQQALEQAILDIQAAMAAAQAAQVAADAAQTTADDAQGKVDGVIDGSVQIETLNVAGTDVTPFLQKTDGSKLVDSTGLDSGVVVTDTLETEAVTTSDYEYNAAVINGNTSSPVTLATVSITVDAGDRVDLVGNCSIATGGSGAPVGAVAQIGKIFIYRNGSPLTDSERYGAVAIRGTAYGVSATVAVSDVPGAGSFTYTFVSELSGTSGVTGYDLSNRYLVATRVKR